LLYSEDRQGRKKGFYPLIFAGLLSLTLFAGCDDNSSDSRISSMTVEAFSDLRTAAYVLDAGKIRDNIEALCRADGDRTLSGRYLRKYYLTDKGRFIWIDRLGTDGRSDTLLAYVSRVGEMGFASSVFGDSVIAADLRRIRSLDFDNAENCINKVASRLEYRLTKAFLKYSSGQRFGFVNPQYLLNRLDVLEDSPSTAPAYRRLFDVPIERPDNSFFSDALRRVSADSVGSFLAEVQPRDTLYYKFQRELKASGDKAYRKKIICNMERCRWREKDRQDCNGKRVVVNIPAYHLYAFDGDSVLDMKVGCGTRKTKTPLLMSEIERMEVNPVWNIPVSIIRNEVSLHAGDPDYFERNRYYIVHRESGEHISPEDVTPEMLKSGKYRVAQEGGAGNSLGRIVFRFANNFSVFLHDTSSRAFFGRNNRGVSHGCVRVERPFDLARFLLGVPDEWLLDRLRISMDIPPQTLRGRKYVANEDNNRKLVNSLQVKPHVPLSITYYTIYPDPLTGRLAGYPDVYGYDDVIYDDVKPFLE